MGGQETASSNIGTGQAANISYSLTTIYSGGKFAFVDDSFEQNGELNPMLEVELDQIVKIRLINGDGITHDLVIQEFGVKTSRISQKGQQTVITFKAEQLGDFAYYCSIPGHRQAGMEGILRVQK